MQNREILICNPDGLTGVSVKVLIWLRGPLLDWFDHRPPMFVVRWALPTNRLRRASDLVGGATLLFAGYERHAGQVQG